MSKIAERYGIDLSKPGKTGCPRCQRNGRDRHSENLMVYGPDKGAFCWSAACGFTIPSEDHKDAMGWEDNEEEDEEVTTREPLTDEEKEAVKSYTGTKGKGYRGIRDEVNRAFGVRYKYDEETGEPVAQYVPTTYGVDDDGNPLLVGYRVRVFPKDFSQSIGQVGKEVDLVGQWKFANANKYCIIAAGEIKMLAIWQMMLDEIKQKGRDYDPPAVVCSTLGEGGAYKQVKQEYEFFDQFERVYICMDNDKAGKDAAEKIAQALPKGKAWIINLRLKDPDSYISVDGVPQHKEHEFIRDFWNAKPWTPDGIVGSGSVAERRREAAMAEKIPLPPFMHKLQKLMAGGIPLRTIINLGSASGTGKSTIVDEMTYYWIFNSPYKPGIVTLESDVGQYGTKLLSRHISQKIDLIETVQDKMSLYNNEEVQQKERELDFKENGEQRYFLIEDRDGGLDSLKAKIEQLIIQCDCQLIILDPLQDILDGLSNEEQAVFLKWMKGMVKSHAVTFINVSHVRKSNGGQKANSTGAELFEEDMQGSSSIFKSGACNLLFTRNKEAEDEIERNTTKMKASKIRWTGKTGIAGEYYYDNNTHTMWDLEDWLAKNGTKEY